MKVLLFNGSPHKEGATYTALTEIAGQLQRDGVESEIIQVGSVPFSGCRACRGCKGKNRCAFGEDGLNDILAQCEEADGFVFGSPVYYASANGTLVSFLDRLFYSTRFSKAMKVGASVAVARRGGCSATFDQLNKYFTISGMPIASSQYWNSVHGGMPGQAAEDGEGMQTMRTLARNMTFLMKSIALGREAYGLPEPETKIATNFIR